MSPYDSVLLLASLTIGIVAILVVCRWYFKSTTLAVKISSDSELDSKIYFCLEGYYVNKLNKAKEELFLEDRAKALAYAVVVFDILLEEQNAGSEILIKDQKGNKKLFDIKNQILGN